MAFLENIIYIIVTYREKYWESSSYKSLIESYKIANVDTPLNIFIADNTDIEDWDCSSYKEQQTNVKVFYNKYNNPGLSYVYNRGVDFAKKQKYSWVVLLDQDTILPTNFYLEYKNAIQNSDVSLKVPITLINNKKILSPSKYVGYRSYLYDSIEKGIRNLQGHSFINTGMLININFYTKVGGYNEQIKLDFTDHDFVYKCQNFTNEFEVLDVSLKQDFSSITNTKEQAIKRYQLYLRDLRSFKKDKKNRIVLFFNSDFMRLVNLTVKYKSLDFLKIRLRK